MNQRDETIDRSTSFPVRKRERVNSAGIREKPGSQPAVAGQRIDSNDTNERAHLPPPQRSRSPARCRFARHESAASAGCHVAAWKSPRHNRWCRRVAPADSWSWTRAKRHADRPAPWSCRRYVDSSFFFPESDATSEKGPRFPGYSRLVRQTCPWRALRIGFLLSAFSRRSLGVPLFCVTLLSLRYRRAFTVIYRDTRSLDEISIGAKESRYQLESKSRSGPGEERSTRPPLPPTFVRVAVDRRRESDLLSSSHRTAGSRRAPAILVRRSRRHRRRRRQRRRQAPSPPGAALTLANGLPAETTLRTVARNIRRNCDTEKEPIAVAKMATDITRTLLPPLPLFLLLFLLHLLLFLLLLRPRYFQPPPRELRDTASESRRRQL